MEKQMGVYIIRNIINNKIYIGSSKNINKRKNQHWRQLLHNNHECVHLQNAWNKYGKDNFKFEVIEGILDFNILRAREQFWLDYYKQRDNAIVYNVSLSTTYPLTYGWHHTEETKKKLSTLAKNRTEETKRKMGESKRGIPLSEEHKKKVSASLKGNKRRLGIPHTEETKRKMRQHHKNFIVTEEWLKKINMSREEWHKKLSICHIGQLPWNKGKTNIYTEETKRKMSDARKLYWAQRKLNNAG